MFLYERAGQNLFICSFLTTICYIRVFNPLFLHQFINLAAKFFKGAINIYVIVDFLDKVESAFLLLKSIHLSISFLVMGSFVSFGKAHAGH